MILTATDSILPNPSSVIPHSSPIHPFALGWTLHQSRLAIDIDYLAMKCGVLEMVGTA